MKRLTTLLRTFALTGAVLLRSSSLLAQTETDISAGAAGVFPSGARFNGVSLNGLQIGTGVNLSSDGPATGQLLIVLRGTTLLGQLQELTVSGNAATGSVASPGTASFAGTASVDMGDGSPPLAGIPFTVTLTASDQGEGTVTLVLGSTSLPAATTTAGSITIK